MTPSWRALGGESLLIGLLAGLYVSVFYITNNLTMLRGTSIVAVAGILTLPAVVIAWGSHLAVVILGRREWGPGVAVFASVVYLMLAQRPAAVEVAGVRDLFELLGGTSNLFANAVYAIVPASLAFAVFRHNTRAFCLLLGVLALLPVGTAVFSSGRSVSSNGAGFGAEMAEKLQDIELSVTPNLYFILADGYSSFAYMREHAIDVAGFRSFLNSAGFRTYDETFSNYQSTLDALPALLNMDHHYYQLSRGFEETKREGRVITGGDNNLVDLLRRNGYRTQSIHQGSYLLLQGCTMDDCHPQSDGLAGARILLGRIFQRDLRGASERGFQSESLRSLHQQVIERIDARSNAPIFQYIHLFWPFHTPNHSDGSCDEAVESVRYAERVARTNRALRVLLSDILSRDPEAAIVITGDHGPYIVGQCGRRISLGSVTDYRDRAGALMAVRWPAGYDGRYDERMKTTVNLFRYVLASMTQDDEALLATRVADDVYAKGADGVLKIVEDGAFLVPPQPYAP